MAVKAAERTRSWPTLGALICIAASSSLSAACGGGDRRSVEDIEIGEATEVEPEADVTVLSISRQGTVLGRTEDEYCAYALEGDVTACWPLETPMSPNVGVSWSPDGSKAAIADLGAVQRLRDSDIVIVDVTGGEERVLADDDTDDASGNFDLAPTWIDDDTVAFVRLAASSDDIGDRRSQLVRLDLDEDAEETSVDIDIDAFTVVETVSVDDGVLISATPLRGEPAILAVDEKGDDDTVFEADETSVRLWLDASSEGDAMVVSGVNVASFEFPPVAYIGGDENAISGEFGAAAAALDSSGDLVAAITPGEGDEPQSLTLWDPETDETQSVPAGPSGLVIGTVWTGDDVIATWGAEEWMTIALDSS